MIAVLCSGQGAQHREMFALTAAAAQAEPVFAAAAAQLGGVDPRRFVQDTEDEALFSNHAGQILCCTQALAAWSALRDAMPAGVMLAGYSVGELAAWGCAGMVEADTLMTLAAARARAMDDAAATLDYPCGALAGIVGLRRDRIDALLRETGASLAIVNGRDSVVVGGEAASLEAFCVGAVAAGASRVVRLRVAVPAHTPALAGASASFRSRLEATPLRRPTVPLLSGIDGDRVESLPEARDKLAAQISNTIDWSACLSRCAESGATATIELGPGRMLARLTSASVPGVETRALEEFRSPGGVRSWLARLG